MVHTLQMLSTFWHLVMWWKMMMFTTRMTLYLLKTFLLRVSFASLNMFSVLMRLYNSVQWIRSVVSLPSTSTRGERVMKRRFLARHKVSVIQVFILSFIIIWPAIKHWSVLTTDQAGEKRERNRRDIFESLRLDMFDRVHSCCNIESIYFVEETTQSGCGWGGRFTNQIRFDLMAQSLFSINPVNDQRTHTLRDTTYTMWSRISLFWVGKK